MKTIYIKFTDECNLHCKHCYIGERTKHHLDVQQFINGFKTIHEPDNEYELVFHGGEPMLRAANIIYIIKEITFPNIRYNITTNLTYNLGEKELGVLDKCNVATSYDAGNIRFITKDQFDLGRENCKRISYKEHFQVNIVLTNELLEMSPGDIYELCLELGIKSIHFERLTKTGNALKLNAPDWRDVDDGLCKAYEMKPDGIRVIEFEELELSAKHNILSGCRARKCSEDVLTVNPDGTIATCPNQFKDIISNIYNGMYNYNAYECVKCKEKKRNSACMTCDLYRYCNGDCFQQQWQGNICAFPKKLFGLLAPK